MTRHCADPRPGGMLGPPMPRRTSCSSPSSSWRSVLAGLLTGAVLVAGCSKAKPGTEAPDAMPAAEDTAAAEPEASPLDDGLASYENELLGYEDAMLAAGLELPDAVVQTRTDAGQRSVPASDGGGDAGGPRCERICGLATNICELRDRICQLGDEHREELRYQRACERATLDCERATQACEGCDG